MVNWNIIIKVATGLVVVPICISAFFLWQWWVKTSIPNRIMSGILILPIVGMAYILTPWWNGF